MNKGDVAKALADGTGLTAAAADRVMNALFGSNGIIVRGLKSGEKKVTITGFGTFTMRHRKARTGISVRTKRKINIPARDVPGFTPGATFKADTKKAAPKAAAPKKGAKAADKKAAPKAAPKKGAKADTKKAPKKK